MTNFSSQVDCLKSPCMRFAIYVIYFFMFIGGNCNTHIFPIISMDEFEKYPVYAVMMSFYIIRWVSAQNIDTCVLCFNVWVSA